MKYVLHLLAELLLLSALALLVLEFGAEVALFLVAPRPASRLLSKEGLHSKSTYPLVVIQLIYRVRHLIDENLQLT